VERIVELKVSLGKLRLHSRRTETYGIARETLLLVLNSERVVTDRLIVTDEAVRVLGIGK
jgi:hypothetical protein